MVSSKGGCSVAVDSGSMLDLSLTIEDVDLLRCRSNRNNSVSKTVHFHFQQSLAPTSSESTGTQGKETRINSYVTHVSANDEANSHPQFRWPPFYLDLGMGVREDRRRSSRN